MLEANTDRMWFTIGSILIGASLVMIATNSLPVLYEKAFAFMEDFEVDTKDRSVIDFETATRVPFEMNTAALVPWINSEDYVVVSDKAVKIKNHPTDYRGGIRIDRDLFKLGERYTITFDMKKLSGEVQGVGGHIQVSDKVDVTIDGKPVETWVNGYGQSPTNQWFNSVVYPNDYVKHRVELTFTKTTDDPALDRFVYVQPNRAGGPNGSGYAKNALNYELLFENLEVYQHQ